MPAGSETSEKSSSELSAKGSLNSKADDDDSNQKQNSVQLCTEVFDEHSSPTEDGKFIIKILYLDSQIFVVKTSRDFVKVYWSRAKV